MNNMTCGCTDKLKTNNKILRLDSMQGLSIDDIINLYRDGYRLEDTIENVGIVSLSCTGTPRTDIYNAVSEVGGINIYKGSVGACKIMPSSKCLDSILFYSSRQYSNSYTLYIEIRENDSATNMPKGTPGNATGLIKQVSTTFDTSSGYNSVTIMAELPDISVPYWITIRSSDYVCNSGTIADTRVELSRSSKSGNNRAYYGPAVPCAWSYSGTTDTWAMEIFKTTYATSSVLTSIVVSTTSASVNIGSFTQLTATCKDQNTNTMTCPTPLTWTSSNPSKASVDSTGKVTGVATGTTNITATYGSVTSNPSVITVSSATPILTSIVVSPASASVSIGSMTQLTATCKDQGTNTMTCPTPLTWSSSSPSKATVDSTGIVTGVAAGTTDITATYGSVTGNSSTITIPSVSLVLTSISPANVTLLLNATQQFTAKDQYTNEINTGVTWTKTVGVGSISTTGLYSAGTTAGTATISATYSGITKTASITVSTTPPATEGGGAGMLIGLVGVVALGIMMTAKKSPQV